MGLADSEQELIEDQRDFSGGLNMISENPAENEYRYAENIVVRTGKPETRPGIRRAFRVNQAGLRQQFSFDNFWFPFSFVSSVFTNIQGSAFFRFLADSYERQIIVSGGDVWVHDSGFVSQITTSSTIGSDETVVFIPAYNYLMLLRSGGSPMYWDGSSNGFIAVPDGTPQSIPDSANGEYISGRLWLIKDRDDLYVSDPISITDFDYVHQLFSIRKGDGDEIVRVYPFHEDYCLVFKKKSVSYLGGVNAAVIGGTNLDDYITIANATNDAGLVAKNAIVTSGEQVHFLSYKGITSIERVQQGKLMGVSVPLSAKIQPIINRINWASVSIACAGTHKNYLLFSFPIDGADKNNCTAVYDSELQTWVSIWTSKVFFPVQYYSSNEKLYALCNDGAMRELFSNDPWDSEDVYDDTPIYDSTEFVRAGEYRTSEIGGVKKIFKALVENTGTSLLDTDTWEEQADPQNLYRVESVLWTRYYRHGDAYNPKRPSRCKVVYEHQNPKLSLDIESEDYDTVKNILTDKEYSQTVYDLANKTDWVANNENLDFKTPGRQDYTVFISTALGRQEQTGDVYVSPTGSNTAPYSTLATAATSIQTAVDYATAGQTVIVDDGIYTLSATITISKALTIRSRYGADNCIVDGAFLYCGFTVTAASVVIDGFTIRYCKAYNSSAISYTSGNAIEIRSCVLYGNWSVSTGGAISVGDAGIVDGCTITGNKSGIYGAGLFLSSGGTIRSCVVTGNKKTSGTSNDVEITTGSTTRNGISYCDISVIYDGTRAPTNQSIVGFQENIQTDPWFTSDGSGTPGHDFVAGNYRLKTGSPCAIAGSVQSWMLTASDATGYQRAIDSVSMGAYEYGAENPALWIDVNGLDLDVWTTHAFRFIPILQNSTGYSIRLTNTQGKFRLKQIISRALPTRRSVRSK